MQLADTPRYDFQDAVLDSVETGRSVRSGAIPLGSMSGMRKIVLNVRRRRNSLPRPSLILAAIRLS